jgi:putative hemolysin
MLEELVGSITDEFDEEERQNLIKLSNGDLIVSGDTTLSDLEGLLDIEFEEDEYDTIAGLVISQLDRVPEETEKPVVNYKNLRIKVLKVEENAIAKVLIHINPVEVPEDAKEESSKGDE